MSTTDLFDLVVVANRLPVAASREDHHRVTWRESPGGLVATLAPVVVDRRCAWVGWSGIDAESGAPLPRSRAQLGHCTLVEVPLSRELVVGYYEGFSTGSLWPLYHGSSVVPRFSRSAWTSYVEANRAFAAAAAAAAAPGATVWVHDSQLQLVPVMLRETRPDLRIGFFLHIPFPPVRDFRRLPWRRAVLEGLLGADVVGFQTRESADAFLHAVAHLTDASMGARSVDIGLPGARRTVIVDVFPASVDVDRCRERATAPQTALAAQRLRESLGSPQHLLLGVDRLDYTKGIDVRIRAFRELLRSGRADPRSTVLLQVASPTRTAVPEYRATGDEIARQVGTTVGELRDGSSAPLSYLHAEVDRDTLAALYLAADVMVVTPYADGVNLVCKEYVASRLADDGALVLSEFAGAADALGGQAFVVNPYDVDSVAGGMRAALEADDDDLRSRMSAMRKEVQTHDVHAWADAFLTTLRGWTS